MRTGARENECQISQNDILHMKFSELYLQFEIYLSGSHEPWSLVLLQIINYIYGS